ncbi:MAG: hypothetical protein LAT68_00500 [Cyclobacteriaceae bacterium]|nr:hypothetical protein [Cyclobacteriaceae bacterium]MCH8514782.1 hypothetical protein [Cyclobacteriaceae bacterium]
MKKLLIIPVLITFILQFLSGLAIEVKVLPKVRSTIGKNTQPTLKHSSSLKSTSNHTLKRLQDTEGQYTSSRQLFYGLETAVINNTRTVPQFGTIRDTGDEGGDFIFIRR